MSLLGLRVIQFNPLLRVLQATLDAGTEAKSYRRVDGDTVLGLPAGNVSSRWVVSQILLETSFMSGLP